MALWMEHGANLVARILLAMPFVLSLAAPLESTNRMCQNPAGTVPGAQEVLSGVEGQTNAQSAPWANSTIMAGMMTV